jgi:predicted HTH transcriptional regulator
MEKISVLNLLKENPQITKEEIRGITNFDELEIELAIKDLIDDGRILDTGYGFELLKK